MPHAIIDMDAIKYAAASAGEKRTINVIHKTSGRERPFKNRTEFWGGPKRDGGWLATINEQEIKFAPDDFEIHDVQTPDKLDNILYTARSMVERWIKSIQAETHVGFLGKGDSWRVERSTILKYKGNREDLIKPVYLTEVGDFLKRQFNVRVVSGLEADDHCVIAAYKKPTTIVLAVDKDSLGSPCRTYNPNRPEDGIVNGDCFGVLYKDDKGKVRGYGRLFLYHQICFGDKIDNYRANSACAMKWGEVSSYNALKDCKNDREAWMAMKAVYQKLYPKPTTVKGWRGDEIEVDWLYMLRENFQMARMLRWEGDDVDAVDVLDKMALL